MEFDCWPWFLGQDSQDINSKLLVRFCQTYLELLQMYDNITKNSDQSSEPTKEITEVLYNLDMEICTTVFIIQYINTEIKMLILLNYLKFDIS